MNIFQYQSCDLCHTFFTSQLPPIIVCKPCLINTVKNNNQQIKYAYKQLAKYQQQNQMQYHQINRQIKQLQRHRQREKYALQSIVKLCGKNTQKRQSLQIKRIKQEKQLKQRQLLTKIQLINKQIIIPQASKLKEELKIDLSQIQCKGPSVETKQSNQQQSIFQVQDYYQSLYYSDNQKQSDAKSKQKQQQPKLQQISCEEDLKLITDFINELNKHNQTQKYTGENISAEKSKERYSSQPKLINYKYQRQINKCASLKSMNLINTMTPLQIQYKEKLNKYKMQIQLLLKSFKSSQSQRNKFLNQPRTQALRQYQNHHPFNLNQYYLMTCLQHEPHKKLRMLYRIRKLNNQKLNLFYYQLLANPCMNIRQVKLKNLKIQDLPKLKQLENLSILDVSQNELKNVNFLQNSKKITQLKLYKNKIKTFTYIQNLSKLKLLSINNNPYEYKSIDYFFRIKFNQLQKISIGSSYCSNYENKQWIMNFLSRKYQKLKSIIISSNINIDVNKLQNNYAIKTNRYIKILRFQ